MPSRSFLLSCSDDPPVQPWMRGVGERDGLGREGAEGYGARDGPARPGFPSARIWIGLMYMGFAWAGPLRAQADPPGSLKADTDSKYGKTCISGDCHPVEVSGTRLKHPPYLEGQCLACHEDHSSPAGGLLKPGGDSLCLSCHTGVEMNSEGGRLAHPPSEKECVECHHPHESHARNRLRSDEQIRSCAECHSDFLKLAREMPHRHKFFEPVTECGSCHYAHKKGEGKYLQENLTESCLTCHDLPIRVEGRVLEDVAKDMRESKFVHGAMKEAGCQTCHTPHGSIQPSLLREGYPAGMYEAYKTEDYRLCWQCHDPAIVESKEALGVTGFRNGQVNLHRVHVAELKRGRACHICHTAHASETPHLLREQIRFKNWEARIELTFTSSGGSCATPCHARKAYERGAGRAASGGAASGGADAGNQ